MPRPRWEKETDCALACALAVAGLVLYVRTLAPSVVALFDDSLEFQLVCYQLGIAHPTGYPLYTLLGKLFAFLPLGDAAYRVNLLSAVAGASTWALLFAVGRALGLRRVGAVAGAVALGTSPVFWSQATVAEVYALHCLFVALLLFLAVRWGRARDPWTARSRLWALAFALGLSLTHHRMTLLLLPALALYAGWVTLSRQASVRRLVLGSRRRPGFWGQAAGALVSFALPLALYAYIPLRGRVATSLDGQYVNTWPGFWDWVLARAYGVFLGENPLARDLDAAFHFGLFRDQFGLLGLALAGLGFLALLQRPREWTLLAVAFAVQTAFALQYRVGDVEVFFLPAFLLAALFLGAGVSLG
ncbi:MAG: glycosyltransferase family 117 protein, partial [Anaerolineae bacterium]